MIRISNEDPGTCYVTVVVWCLWKYSDDRSISSEYGVKRIQKGKIYGLNPLCCWKALCVGREGTAGSGGRVWCGAQDRSVMDSDLR